MEKVVNSDVKDGGAMRDVIIFSCLCLATLLMNCAKEGTIHQESPVYQNAELILELDASYDFDYYAGHRFICPVKRVIKGLFEEKTIMVEISLAPKARESYAGYLKPFKEYESLVLGFTNIPEVPTELSGFKDNMNRYWEILFVAKMASLPRD